MRQNDRMIEIIRDDEMINDFEFIRRISLAGGDNTLEKYSGEKLLLYSAFF